MSEQTEPVRLVVEGRLATLVLAQPERHNALGLEMGQSLERAVAGAVQADVAVVLITHEGTSFSVGGDVRGFASAEQPAEHITVLADTLHRVISVLNRMDAVVVTAVNGMAAGAGVPLAAAGDVVLASEAARFTLAYTKIGLSPDGGSSLLPASLGLHRALRLALLNPVVGAEEAQALGLVAEVLPVDGFAEGVDRVVQQLLAGSRSAQVAAKRLLRAQALASPESAMERETLSIARQSVSPDGLEGVRAFVEGRRPAFGQG